MDTKPVAPRFSLQLPMRYRPAGDSRWRDTTTKNVSSSGVLFLTTEPLQPGRKLEIEIMMAATSPLKPSRVVATSEVIRQTLETDALLTAVRHLRSQTHTAGEPSAPAPARSK